MNTLGHLLRRRQWSRYAWMALLLIVTLLLGSCSSTQVVQTASGYEVRRLDEQAHATTDIGQPHTLLLLDDTDWHGLEGVRMATTDAAGQVEIRGPGCEAVFIFQNSGLTMNECPRGGGTGACSQGTFEIRDCEVSIQTLPANVDIAGSWVWVTYLEHTQVTLVIVVEGYVAVTPATVLEAKVVDPEALQYEIAARELGQTIDTTVDEGEPPGFLYTASNDRLAQLQEVGDLPPSRTWMGLEALAPLRELLSRRNPELNKWLDQIEERAAEGGVLFPQEREQRPTTLVTLVDGEVQPDLAVQWEVSEDGLRWTFYLDEGRRMSDGTPYTSEVVEQVLTGEEQGFERIKGYQGVEALDDHTFTLYLYEPNKELLEQLATIELPQ